MLSLLIVGAHYSFLVGVIVVCIAATGHCHRADRWVFSQMGRQRHHAHQGHRASSPVPAARAGVGGHSGAIAHQCDDCLRDFFTTPLRAPDACLRVVRTVKELCDFCARGGCWHHAIDVRYCAAQLSSADHRADGTVNFHGYSGCRCLLLTGDGRANPDNGMGHHAGRSARINTAWLVGGDVPGHCNSCDGVGHHPDG